MVGFVCRTEAFGLHRSVVVLDISTDVTEVRDLLQFGSLNLALPRPLTAFFPSRPMAELRLSGEDENETFVHFSGPFRFETFWQRREMSQGFAQLLVFGRSGYGPAPFPSSSNEILVRLTLPTTISCGSRGVAGLSVFLPTSYECLGAQTLLDLALNEADSRVLEALEAQSDLMELFESLGQRPATRHFQGTPSAWRQRGTKLNECFLDLARWDALYAGQQLFLQVMLQLI